jgi:hypothetical protein
MLFTAKRPSHLSTSHLHVTSGQAAPRLGHGLGDASERARVWFTVLLLPASQMVYTKSTL